MQKFTPPPKTKIQSAEKLKRFVVNVSYPEKEKRALKMFCRFVGEDLGEFTRASWKTEMEKRLGEMEKKKRQHIELLLTYL